MNASSAYLRKLIIAFATSSIILIVTAGSRPDGGLEQAAERSGKSFDRHTALEERRKLHQWLEFERVPPGQARILEAAVSLEEMAEVDSHQGNLPVRVGLTKALDADVSFSDVRLAQLRGRSLFRPHGAITGNADGG